MDSDDTLPWYEAITQGVKASMITGVFEKGKSSLKHSSFWMIVVDIV